MLDVKTMTAIINSIPKYIEDKNRIKEKCENNRAFGITKITESDLKRLITLICNPNKELYHIETGSLSPLDFYSPTENSLFQYDVANDCFRCLFWSQATWGQCGLMLLRIYDNLDISLSVLDAGSYACRIHNQIEARKIIDKYIK